MKGYIYKLTSPNTDMIYIGSTTQKLADRLTGHKSDWNLGNKNNESSRVMFDCGNVSIHLIRECECDTIRDLQKQEQIEMDNHNGEICNEKRAYRTPEMKAEQVLKYKKTDKCKKSQKKYNNTIERKEYMKKYSQTDKWKASRNTDEFKEYVKHYKYWSRTCGLTALSKLKPLFHDI